MRRSFLTNTFCGDDLALGVVVPDGLLRSFVEALSYKERVATTFDRRGTSYSASTFHQDLAKRLLELAELRPGQSVLDVATGTGLVAIPAAYLIEDKGRVLGVDLSEGMLEQARKVAAEEGLANLTFERGDVDTLELGTERFDAILCCSALIYLTDIPRALER